MSAVPSSGSGQCRTCGGLALYQPVPDGPWWTHDDSAADHRVVIDPDTTSYGPNGVRLPSTESTSAALRRVQAELDAERDKRAEDIAAYERACGLAVVAERERDRLAEKWEKALSEGDELTVRWMTARRERDEARAELASARTELDAVRTARDNLDRQLAEACAETLRLAAARSWIVARDGGRDCVRCGLEIRRGEAYELHNAGADELEHIHCRDRTEER